MKEELLAKLRQEKDSIVASVQTENKRKKRLKQVLKNPLVQEFLELANISFNADLEERTIDEDKIIRYLQLYYRDVVKENGTNGIYMCIGKNLPGFRSSNGKYCLDYYYMMPTPNSIPCAYYRNIETSLDSYIIPMSECEEFEKNHEVILGSFSEYAEIYQDFWKTAIDKSQEKALKKVRSKYSRL